MKSKKGNQKETKQNKNKTEQTNKIVKGKLVGTLLSSSREAHLFSGPDYSMYNEPVTFPA